MMSSAVRAMHAFSGLLCGFRAFRHCASTTREHGSRGSQRGVHLQGSVHLSRNDLQRLRKSCSWRTTSCLTASTVRHHSWMHRWRSASSICAAWSGRRGRTSALSAWDGARSWEKATGFPRVLPTPAWTPPGVGHGVVSCCCAPVYDTSHDREPERSAITDDYISKVLSSGGGAGQRAGI